MKCYTVFKNTVTDGIVLEKDYTIKIGEEGRGRQIVKVSVPMERAKIQPYREGQPKLMELSAQEDGVLAKIVDMSGFRGSWEATGEFKLLAKGRCAQGDAGRMGGGPEFWS
jgi:hypothetical protein